MIAISTFCQIRLQRGLLSLSLIMCPGSHCEAFLQHNFFPSKHRLEIRPLMVKLLWICSISDKFLFLSIHNLLNETSAWTMYFCLKVWHGNTFQTCTLFSSTTKKLLIELQFHSVRYYKNTRTISSKHCKGFILVQKDSTPYRRWINKSTISDSRSESVLQYIAKHLTWKKLTS